MKRREHELYGPHNDSNSYATAMAIKLKCPNIRPDLEFLEQHLGNTEHIRITYWVDSMFYLEVHDTRPSPAPNINGRPVPCAISRWRMALTINVAEDKIFWNDDKSVPLFNGGNCFVRAPRWKGLMKKRFNLTSEEMFLKKFRSYSSKEFFDAFKVAKNKP